ncbi:MAG TPA: hypothetical protein DHU55_00245 [Blastocatellia bacterium]|jgi:hypothetical protein|nr:hypothetical protein [Blastocatellia bacterium]HAF23462.1 hypothetical protein [Blastocatellia bacterium]HCX28199.1 hypothetical protein [Blastocatellia bacterium]
MRNEAEVLLDVLWASSAALAAGVVLATTTYFQYVGLLGILAVFAAILAVLFGRAIASRMGAFVFWDISHRTNLLSDGSCFGVILRLKILRVKDGAT